ncbi:MAG: patatin-like phospholipase family protein [Gemmatimonas sp.]
MPHDHVRRAMRPAMSALAALSAWMLSACASYEKTRPLATYDLNKGYRFEQLQVGAPGAPRNSDELFVVLAFSGGGTRAAALSYGVLAQLKAIKLHLDPVTKLPTSCAALSAEQCAAGERTLLDEVDVISTVSGGSFPAAYYALHGDDIFNPQSRFQKDFLYHEVQSDLMKHALYYPKNWMRARARVEVAANYYADNVFGKETYAKLATGKRPFVILNSTDASTGARFEFTQEQFDLLCADLDQFPVARAVAASSAFPVLLNSMTVDSYNAGGGCKYEEPEWVGDAIEDGFTNYNRFNAARQLRAYRDSVRRHLHIMDGGLADNIGLRSALQSFGSTDRPLNKTGGKHGGWSALAMINQKKISTVLVITVNAKTNKEKTWDLKKAGPGIAGIIDASASIPMGNYTAETLQLLRQFGIDAGLNVGGAASDPATANGAPRFMGVDVTIENIKDAGERRYFNELGTNFQLPPFAVTCLADRGAQLLRESGSVTDLESQPFADFVRDHLKGTMSAPAIPHEAACTEYASKQKATRMGHTVDVGLQYNVKIGTNSAVDDVTKSRHNIGLLLRIAKPTGLGATLGFTRESFITPGFAGLEKYQRGRLTLTGLTAGALLSGRVKAVQGNLSLAGGVAHAGFDLSNTARDRFTSSGYADVRTSAGWTPLLRPGAALWIEVLDKAAVTFSGSYIMANPTIRYKTGSPSPLSDERVQVRAFRLAAGIGYRIF